MRPSETREGYPIGPRSVGRVGVSVARYLARGGGWLQFLPKSEGPGEWVRWYRTKREAWGDFAPDPVRQKRTP